MLLEGSPSENNQLSCFAARLTGTSKGGGQHAVAIGDDIAAQACRGVLLPHPVDCTAAETCKGLRQQRSTTKSDPPSLLYHDVMASCMLTI